MSEYLIYLVVAVAVAAIVFYLLRSIIATIIVVVIAVIIFKIGWVYSADELFEKFKLNEIINPKYQEEFYDKYSEYEDKRSKDEIISTDKINDLLDEGESKIREELRKKVDEYLNK